MVRTPCGRRRRPGEPTHPFVINGTSNLHEEQLSNHYCDRRAWPTFHLDIERFKHRLAEAAAGHARRGRGLVVLKVSHSEVFTIRLRLHHVPIHLTDSHST